MHDVKSYDFVKQYISNPQLLVKAIKEYRRTANIPKGEYSLSDLLRWALLFWYIGRDSNGHQEINGYQFTENRIESSSMPRGETNGVFFVLNQMIQSMGKVRTNSIPVSTAGIWRMIWHRWCQNFRFGKDAIKNGVLFQKSKMPTERKVDGVFTTWIRWR